MITIASTACAYSLAAYLEAADLVAATSAFTFRTFGEPKDPIKRSFSDSSRGYSTCLRALTADAVTAVSEMAPILLGVDGPEHEVVAELGSFWNLKEGWDGENAAIPSRSAIRDAVRFILAAGPVAAQLEPTLHTDGSILLEIEDGLSGSLKFRGDGHIIYAIKDFSPGITPFNGSDVPVPLRAVLEGINQTAATRRAA